MAQETRLAPWKVEVNDGNVNNSFTSSANATSPPINSGVTSDLWSDGGILVPQTTAQTLRIVSSSADDTAGGTGARLIQVRGLDANFDQQSELVILDGLTPVTTVNTYLRHNRTTVFETGRESGTVTSALAGTLTVDWSGTSDIAATITPTTGGFAQASSRQSHFTVPRDFKAQIEAVSLAVDATKPISVGVMFRINTGVSGAPFGATLLAANFQEFNGSTVIDLGQPLKFPERTDIWIAFTSGANATVLQGGYIALVNRNKA